MRSRFLIAAVIFFSLNACLRFSRSVLLSFPDRLVEDVRNGAQVNLLAHLNDLSLVAFVLQPREYACVDSAVSYLQTQPKHPDVVLLGTSQIEDPLWYLDHPENESSLRRHFYHRCDRLASELSHGTNGKVRLISLATPHALVSDSYLYFERYLKERWKPAVLVIGFQPRDFYDSLYLDLPSNRNFRALTSSGLLASERDSFSISYLDDLQLRLQNLLLLYVDRQAIQNFLSRRFADILAYLPQKPPESQTSKRDKDVSPKYIDAYKGIDISRMQVQVGFLEKILAESKREKIKVILLNMPLTAANLAQLPQGLYEAYLNKLAAVAKQNGAQLLDVSSQCKLDLVDFVDGEHLNPSGAKKLMTLMVPPIQKALAEQREAR